MAGGVGGSDGVGWAEFDTLLWLTARKEAPTKQKQTPPLQSLHCQVFPTHSWQNSQNAPPPFSSPSHVHSLETNPLFDILPFPPIAVATAFRFATPLPAHQRKEVSVFLCQSPRWAGGPTSRETEIAANSRTKTPSLQKLSVHDFSFNPRRGRSRRQVDNLVIRFPCGSAKP